MPWLKLLHISAVVLWCGALLYLPAAIVSVADPAPQARLPMRLPRLLFTAVATPAALVAIASGSAIFLTRGPLADWLIVKLAIVSLMALGHGACGMLILRTERGRHGAGVARACMAVGASSLLWMGCIAWLVLRKPF